MSAGGQDRQRGKRETSHRVSVAQKLACGIAVACACGGGAGAPPVDPDDLDGDGIPNAQDVCPTAQDPAQHDEDGDRVGDACDVCPTVSDPLQADRGELAAQAFDDGVGDACDLRPSRGGDQLRALHTFAVDDTPAWRGAGWTIGGDRAHARGAARWERERAQQGDAMFARLAVEAVTFAAPGAQVAIVLDGDGVDAGRICALVADRDGDGNDELSVRELQGATATRALAGAAAGPLELLVLRGIDRLGGGKVVCRLAHPDGRVEASIEVSIDLIDNTTTGQYAIAAGDADVTVTSLAVYASPTSCPAAAAAACDLP